MTLLFLALLLAAAFCDDKPLVGYISIDNKLLAEIIGNKEDGIQIEVGLKEVFALTMATTSPLRWYFYTPETYPFLRCRQKIIDKDAKTNEVIQLLGCKMPYKGKSFISLGLGTSDRRIKSPRKINVIINVTSSVEKKGPELTEEVPGTIPTVPPPEEVPKLDPPKPKKNNRNPYNMYGNRFPYNQFMNRNAENNENESNSRTNYQQRMQEHLRNMRRELNEDNTSGRDYWNPNRMRQGNRNSPFGNNRFLSDDDYV